jgi:uncharacterized membrane protein YozB (DUF420 family)
MNAFLNRPGFFGTRAAMLADLTLCLILLTAVLFTLGVFLARRKNFTVHRWVQTTAASLNALVVLGVMVHSFVTNILPGVPGKLAQRAYGVPVLHASVGAIGLLLGLFVVLRANGLVPRALRFKNYKLFMRTSYALYMLATLGGVLVYLQTYVIGG